MNAAGIALIKEFEGCSLVAYEDQGGLATIGYGHAVGVKMGSTITAEEAEVLLEQDMAAVEKRIRNFIRQALDENQLSACVCLAYNIGPERFLASTLLIKLNMGMIAQAADQFLVWDKINGVQSPGLDRRRKAEQALFLKPVSA